MYHVYTREWAALLGVSQRTVETEYYIVDIPEIVKAHRQHEAVNRLYLAQISSFPYMEKSGQQSFISALQREAGLTKNGDKFDRQQMDQLHALYAQMGGKA